MAEFNSTGADREPRREWLQFGLRLGVSSALHPFEYAKVLIQIGHEPIAPRLGKTFFGQPAMVLPNIFQYVSYIKKVDGWSGCYRGLFPKLIGNVISSHMSEKMADRLGLAAIDEEKTNDRELTDTELFAIFQKKLHRDVVLHTTGVIVFQPFHVISIRMMAQFIGRETKYSTLFDSIAAIYRDEGILGFFSGLIPRLLCDLATLLVASTATYLVSKYFIKDHEGQQYFSNFSQLVSSTMFYPMNVVSTCMTVSGTSLKAGRPPIMPVYTNWRNCYSSLKATGEIRRGSSLLWRYVQTPSFKFAAMAPYPDAAK